MRGYIKNGLSQSTTHLVVTTTSEHFVKSMYNIGLCLMQCDSFLSQAWNTKSVITCEPPAVSIAIWDTPCWICLLLLLPCIATWHTSKSGFLVATEMVSLLGLPSQQISDRDYSCFCEDFCHLSKTKFKESDAFQVGLICPKTWWLSD